MSAKYHEMRKILQKHGNVEEKKKWFEYGPFEDHYQTSQHTKMIVWTWHSIFVIFSLDQTMYLLIKKRL